MAKRTHEEQIFSLILKLVDAETRARKLGLFITADAIKEAIIATRSGEDMKPKNSDKDFHSF